MLCAVTIIDRISHALTNGPADVVIEPPGSGTGFWAGGPSVVDEDGVFHLAYRLRRPVDQGRGYANVVARSTDGVHFETGRDRAGVHLRVRVAGTAGPDPASGRRLAAVRQLLDTGLETLVGRGGRHPCRRDRGGPGDTASAPSCCPADEVSAWKDVVVTRDGPTWRMWACEHLLDQGEDEADRMRSVYLTSSDGLDLDRRTGRARADRRHLGSARRTHHQRLGIGRQVDRQLRRTGVRGGELVRADRVRGRRHS